MIFSDNVLVYRRDDREHCARMYCKSLERQNVLMNSRECGIEVTGFMFLGHVLLGKGISPAVSRVEGVE